jgi:hypothetical protein
MVLCDGKVTSLCPKNPFEYINAKTGHSLEEYPD